MLFTHERAQKRHDAKKKWHTWFAWYPIKLDTRETAWLQSVQRKGNWTCDAELFFSWDWKYRLQGDY